MSEQRPTYGPQATYQITCHYHVTRSGQVTHCEFNLATEARSADQAALIALAQLTRREPRLTITNLVLQVSLDL